MGVPGELIPIVMFICGAATIILTPVARAYARRLDRGDGGPQSRISPDVTDRLERMEQALDSIAIEVERISEGQRFTTKLLAERNNPAPSSVPDRQT